MSISFYLHFLSYSKLWSFLPGLLTVLPDFILSGVTISPRLKKVWKWQFHRVKPVFLPIWLLYCKYNYLFIKWIWSCPTILAFPLSLRLKKKKSSWAWPTVQCDPYLHLQSHAPTLSSSFSLCPTGFLLAPYIHVFSSTQPLHMQFLVPRIFFSPPFPSYFQISSLTTLFMRASSDLMGLVKDFIICSLTPKVMSFTPLVVMTILHLCIWLVDPCLPLLPEL